MGRNVGSGMESQVGFLVGRTLYDQWSQYWPYVRYASSSSSA
jgi:hypothetical protein